MCLFSMFSELSRSAIVLATLRILSYARAERPSLSKDSSSVFDALSERIQYFRVNEDVILALQEIDVPLKRSNWILRALLTLSRIEAEGSPASFSDS